MEFVEYQREPNHGHRDHDTFSSELIPEEAAALHFLNVVP